MARLRAIGVALAATALTASVTASPATAGVLRGTAFDPGYRDLGPISYMFNRPGFQLWFTPTDRVAPLFSKGHTYHSIYRYQVGSGRGWCGPTTVADSVPYNLGGTAGHTVYYKIKDVTDGHWVCGPGS